MPTDPPSDPPSGRLSGRLKGNRTCRFSVPVAVALAAAAVVAVVGGASCTSSRPGPKPPTTPPTGQLTWQAVRLPGDSEPTSLDGAGDSAVVGGRSEGAPRMFVLSGSLAARPVDLVGHGVYAATASWVDVAVDGSRVLALGRATGGAHGLPRWTVWSGSTERVEEHPQPFETFSGPRSGGLAGVALRAGTSLVLGTWDDGGPGLDTAVWAARGTSWQRVGRTSSALASTATQLPQPAAAAVAPQGIHLVGSTTQLAGDHVVLGAVAWTSPRPEGPWTGIDLPATSDSSRATGLSCDGTGCWVIGLDGDAPTLWRLEGSGVRRVALPPGTVAATGRVAEVAATADQVWLATAGDDDRARLLRREASGSWTVFDGPSGQPVQLALWGDRIGLLTKVGTTSRLTVAAAP